MQATRILFVLAMLALHHAAMAAAPVFGSSKQTNYARSMKPPKGKAIIYIYQRPQDGVDVSPEITLNKYKIGRIVPGSFTVWQLGPGRLELHVAASKPVSMAVKSRAGKVYLFRLVVTRGKSGTRAQLESLPESYRGDLAVCRLIKNPREITPTKQIAVPQAKAPATAAAKPVPRREEKPRRQPRRSLAVGGVGLQVKTGSLSLSSTTQNILSQNRVFDKSTTGLFGIEGYHQTETGLALGGELLGYKAHFVTSGMTDTHDVSVLILLADAKQYYLTASSLQPYLGAGLGVATTSVSGPTIQGNTVGFAYQLVAGVEYRHANIGVFAEAKYLSANTKDSNNQSVDVSGSGIFAGLAIHY